MKTNCSAPFQEEPPAQQIGYGSSRSLYGYCFLLILIVLLWTSGCSSRQPLLTRTVFPLSYQLSDVPEADKIETSQPVSIVHVNNNLATNNHIIKFWTLGWYSDLFKKHHPVLTLKRYDLTLLESALNRLFRIYYLQFNESPQDKEIHLSPEALENILHCKPLTNTEIKFLLNSESQNTFPDIPLTLLVISSHELLLQKGALAEYPRVQSPYLRQRLALPKLRTADRFNLIATKKGNSVYSDMQMGFAICRNSPVLPE